MYMLGIIFSINKKSISIYIKNKSLMLGSLTVLLAIIQAIGYEHYGNFHKNTMISYSGIDIILIQKIFMIFFFLSLLQKIDNREIPLLKYIASVSFAIYFLHPWILFYLDYVGISQYNPFIPEIIILPVKTLFVVCTSLIIATLLKAILREKSRYVIGW